MSTRPPQPDGSSLGARLRQLITSPETAFLMEAHDGLSARIVEESGFDGIWASGLSMSAALGVRDKGAKVRIVYVPGQWLDVDDAADFTKAGRFL